MRVWVVTCGADGRLQAELDERVLATLDAAAGTLAAAAGATSSPRRAED